MSHLSSHPSRRALRFTLTLSLFLTLSGVTHAQYFGRNKVQYGKFDFKVLKTEHFDIHFYASEAAVAPVAGRMAERWYARLSHLFRHDLSTRQPLILYASHPDFEQTNVIEGELGEGTGGVTEGLRRRIVLPMGATLADSDHVLGHELVHAFQYDMLDRNAGMLPLWFIEGMAEYLSIGPRDVQTAMWLRDAAIEDRLPMIKNLDDPRYFPYRFGHAFWAYVAGRWGDRTIASIMESLSPTGGIAIPDSTDPAVASQVSAGGRASAVDMIELVTNMKQEQLSAEWHAAIRETYGVSANPTRNLKEVAGVIVDTRRERGAVNVGPALSPDGTKIAFLSARSHLSIDLYVGDAQTGETKRKLIDTAADPHFESLQFLQSAGTWAPDNRRLAVATIRGGHPVIAIFDGDRGGIVEEIKYEDAGEIFQPAWSPDGNAIAFSAQVGGVTDLFVYDFGSKQVRRLTNDVSSDLQPAWAPDGSRLAFVTDRFSSNLENLTFTGFRIGTVAASGGTVTEVSSSLTGSLFNPQWSRDSQSLFVIADAGGARNVWRLPIAGGAAQQVTNEVTGVAGITPGSPAMSVAAAADTLAMSVFRDDGYEIRIMKTTAVAAPDEQRARLGDLSRLPPTTRRTDLAAELGGQETQTPPAETTFETQPYSSKLHLVGIGQMVGVSTGSMFGTYVGGGISAQFSDELGNHLLGAGVAVAGGVRDISFAVNYMNRTSRWNWGVYTELVPLVSGNVSQGVTTIGGQPVIVQRTNIFRETYLQTGVVTAYPLSRVTRVEFNAGARRISFGREVVDQYFHPVTGDFLGEERNDLPSAEALPLFDTGAALVRDTSVFGATSPIRGQRTRLEFAPTFGDLQFNSLTLDQRMYFMPKQPVTFATRALHVGRYGPDSEDPRLSELFLGYSTLVRGYDVDAFDDTLCTPTPTGACPAFDRLFGSRILVFNGEVRLPAGALKTGRLDYGPVPVELFGFVDAGLAWTQAERPTFANGDRDWIASAGFGARVNLFGFAIGEFNLARPLRRPATGWQFVFNLRPGF
jgi:Tol biopolymer transport system component